MQTSQDNTIRCAIALSVPIVLNYLADPKNRTKIDPIRHLLPSYILDIPSRSNKTISPYFCPMNLKDTGKRRVYINSDGYRIRYITAKMLNRFKQTAENFEDVKSVYSNRWIIMNGDLISGNFKDFEKRIVVVQTECTKSNHPPLGFRVWSKPQSLFDSFDPMLVGLRKYETILRG